MRPTTCSRSILLVFGIAAALGAGTAAHRVEAEYVAVSLVTDTEVIQPGVSFEVGLRFELEDHWHVYWRNPGDSGLEPRVTWHLPTGAKVTPLRWPAPKRIPLEQLVNFGYENEVVLLATITPSATPTAPFTFSVDVDWLVCRQACIPGSGRFEVSLPVGEQAVVNSEKAAILDGWRRRLPLASSDLGWRVAATVSRNNLRITMTAPDADHPLPSSVFFFPDYSGFIDNAKPQHLQPHAQNRSLVLLVPLQPDRTAPPQRLKGVIVANKPGWLGDRHATAVRIDLPMGSAKSP